MTSLLLESAVRATLIIVAVAVILRITTIQSAAFRHAAWVGVAVVMLLLPGLVAFGPRAALFVLPPYVHESTVAMAPVSVPSTNAVTEAQSEPTTSDRGSSLRARNWQMFLFGLYLLGVAMLLIRVGVGALHVRRVVRGAIARHGRLTHIHCATPVTVGWFKPVVILPADWLEWPRDQLDAIVVHENAHVTRRDPLLQGVVLINRAVFWFHPLAWWLERRVSALAEEACDVVVLSRGHDPRRYSEYLLGAARAASRAGGRLAFTGTAMPGPNLSYRIRQILEGTLPPRISRARLVSAVGLCAAAMAICTSATLARAESSPSASLDVPRQANSGQLSASLLALASSDPAQRAVAACELGRMGSGARVAIPDLIAMLEDGTPLPRQLFCGSQPPFEDESWAPEHPEVLEPSPGEAATRALLAIGADAIAPLKQTLVGAPHWRARKNAAWAFAHRGQATDELIAALRDPAWQVRTEAAYALFQRGGDSRQVVDALSSTLSDGDWRVREQATLALGHKGGRGTDVVESLLVALRDENSRVRIAATAGLWHRADQRTWSALVEALRDPDEGVRLGAARAMGNRARDPEVQVLIGARHDTDPHVREGAREALRIVDQRMRGTTTNLTRVQIPFD